MFCWHCGREILGNVRFCGHCGFENSRVSSSGSSPTSVSGTLKTFNEFVKEKCSKTKSKKVKRDRRHTDETTIYASLMDEALKQVKGTRTPVRVDVNWGPRELKSAVFDRLKNYTKALETKSKSDFKLIYKHGDIIRFILGTREPFTVKKYKEDLGVGYNSLSVYLMEYEESGSEEDSDDFSTAPKLITSNQSQNSHASTSTVYSNQPASQSQYEIQETTEQSQNSHASTSTVYSNQPSSQRRYEIQETTGSNYPNVSGDSNHRAFPQISTENGNDEIIMNELQAENSSFGEVMISKAFKVHRLHLKNELLEIFMDPNIFSYDIKMTVIDPRGREEPGAGDGVLRDVICSFFNEFFLSFGLGCDEIVPGIRHTMTKEHWEAVGRLLIYALRVNYFPLKLCKAFLISCIFGEESLKEDCLIDSFLRYISVEDRDCLNEMIKNYDKENEDTLLDILSSYNCYRSPNKENIKELVRELAHQEIVQKPKYIANAISPLLRFYLPIQFATIQKVEEFYIARNPTGRTVAKKVNRSKLNGYTR